MTDADLLLRLGVDSATLDPAPAHHRGTAGPARVGLSPVACTLCAAPARFTRVVDVPGSGPCWLDRCCPCYLATVGMQPSRVPATVDGIVADLRAAAVDAGVALTVLADREAG
ncbi:hypothetical protein [Streptomyces sp. NBC_00568]|uniref:hypothetical protein n=1 Tax=Streptomyces sp. NBC_00568 TaxID=2975779 RepID=UPI0022583FC8|nr:hypothetical protein [Streptomyces sp. NBC_00568]MCX4993417.1 hypothetical protein [Streptomyces sp. NBC_00568]